MRAVLLLVLAVACSGDDTQPIPDAPLPPDAAPVASRHVKGGSIVPAGGVGRSERFRMVGALGNGAAPARSQTKSSTSVLGGGQ